MALLLFYIFYYIYKLLFIYIIIFFSFIFKFGNFRIDQRGWKRARVWGVEVKRFWFKKQTESEIKNFVIQVSIVRFCGFESLWSECIVDI